MAELAFNNLQYMRDLVGAGVPQAQAEVMAQAHFTQVENLVSRDYLDGQLARLEERINSFPTDVARACNRASTLLWKTTSAC